MPSEEFVIKLNDQTELYLKIYSPVRNIIIARYFI